MSRLPTFLIIGAQRCGTTSLYHYLAQHPQIAPSQTKEVHFFDLQFAHGPDWYAEQFPALPDGDRRITGEASPYYLFHPCVPQRVRELLPNVRLIVLLRNPVARAISHYMHQCARNFEPLPFADALYYEAMRLAGEEERLLADAHYRSVSHQCYSYLARGRYAEQLHRWMTHFPREQFCILRTEDLAAEPEHTLAQICQFLGVEPYAFDTSIRHNRSVPAPVDAAIRRQLTDYFRAPNDELSRLLGYDLRWEADTDWSVPPGQELFRAAATSPAARTLIVTGMHRSGTSLLASLLARVGLHIGDQLMPESSGNPRGYFEDEDFVDLHTAMLHSRGQLTMVDRQFVPVPTVAEMAQAIVLIEARTSRPLWGWKDPRTCLFLDLWRWTLPSARYVFVYRHPLDVLLSLMRRDEPGIAGLVEALESWYTYNQRLLAFATAYPERCIICHIGGVLAAPERLADLLCERFGMSLALGAADVAALYQPDELRRLDLDPADVAVLTRTQPEVVALYQELERRAHLPCPPDSAWLAAVPSQASLASLEAWVTLISLCARVDPQTTEAFYAHVYGDMNALIFNSRSAAAHAEHMQHHMHIVLASHREAERYANSLEAAFREAEVYARIIEAELTERTAELATAATYANSLETARDDAERYAQSLEAEIERLRQALQVTYE